MTAVYQKKIAIPSPEKIFTCIAYVAMATYKILSDGPLPHIFRHSSIYKLTLLSRF
jgi:hypothetical protein